MSWFLAGVLGWAGINFLLAALWIGFVLLLQWRES